MRSSVIAEELISRGFDVVFIGNTAEIPWLNKYVEKLGFREVLTSSDIFVSNPNSDVLILDSYEIDPSTAFIQSVNWSSIIVLVDDQTPSFFGNLYIHPGSGTSWQLPASSQKTEFLSGVKYLMIRKSVRELRSKMKHVGSFKPQILISGGGSDPYNFSEEIYKILRSTEFDFDAKILAPEFPIENNEKRFEFLKMGSDFESVLAETDLAFTTAGTSSWEFLYLGLITGVACAIPNQEANYKVQVNSECAIGVGNRDSLGNWKLDPKVILEMVFASNKNRHLTNLQNQFEIGKEFLALIEQITNGKSTN